MRPAALAVTLIGAVAIGAVMIAGKVRLGGGASSSEQTTSTQMSAEEPSPRGATAAAAPTSPPKPAETARRVAPGLVAAPQLDTTKLERVAPRPPLGKLGQAAHTDPNEWKDVLLPRPVADAAGRLSAAGYTITIAGVRPLGPDETCKDASGQDWPCGRRARTAFRAWLRGRSIECHVPARPQPKATVTRCTLADDDIGQWLVANGWARTDGDRYAKVAETAEKNRLGIHGDGR